MDTRFFPLGNTSPILPRETREPVPDLDIGQLRCHMPVTRRKVQAGQYLYRNGEAFRALFLVHVGFMKTCELAADGREQVTGFRMQGDLLGVDSIGLPAYGSDAVALEDCVAWELPYPPVLLTCLRVPDLQARLTAALAEEIRRDRNWMLSIGTLSAEHRVATFLLDLGSRLARVGFSARHFILRMGRADIASFLALQHETVTRALTRLENQGYISVRRREVKLLDLAALRDHAGQSCAIH